MTITLYGIPNCDTVKTARAWLQANGREVRFHDFKKLGVPADRLEAWLAAAGWERLVNRRGTAWRQLGAELQASVVDADSAKRVLIAHPSVVKRPVVEWPGGAITVGFEAGDWSRR
jgi:arsenate reductase (glutaredoxin)